MKTALISILALASLSTPAFAGASDTDLAAKAKTLGLECFEEQPSVESFTVQGQKHSILTCTAGAYNAQSIMLRESEEGGVVPVAFPVPVLGPRNGLQGFSAEIVTSAASYDPQSGKITTFFKARGLGDAFSLGTYQFSPSSTQLVLRKYEIDSSFDGKINPQVVYKATNPLR